MPLFLFLSARYFLLWLPWLPLCLSFSCLDRASSLPPPRSCWGKEGRRDEWVITVICHNAIGNTVGNRVKWNMAQRDTLMHSKLDVVVRLLLEILHSMWWRLGRSKATLCRVPLTGLCWCLPCGGLSSGFRRICSLCMPPTVRPLTPGWPLLTSFEVSRSRILCGWNSAPCAG